MGFSRKRVMPDGTVRYQALYKNARREQLCAGTYASETAADKAWQRAEVELALGHRGDPRRGRQTFKAYVENKWLPHHVIEASTRQDYTYKLKKHLYPYFGPMKMRDIYPEHVREWITWMQNKGSKPATIQKCKRAILNAIFTTALQDQVISVHPGHGVKIPPVPKKPLKIITATQFGELYEALPDADSQLLVETDIEGGLRWGELTELRVKDLDFDTGILTVSRAVVELAPEFHPTGGRFLVKEYPKDGEYRRFKLSSQIVAKLKAHVQAKDLQPDDLFFRFKTDDTGPDAIKIRAVLTDELIETLGKTEPNLKGHRYDHSTLTAYTTGGCRCDYCKEAYRVYRAARRANGKDSPRKPRRKRDSDGHIPNDWFRNNVWNPACTTAGLTETTPHGLRHAHASWLIAGGADLQVVKERLGHGSIATTEKYLHTLPNADETALDALSKIRNQDSRPAIPSPTDELAASQKEIAHLRGVIADLTIAQHANGKPHLRPA